jgi:hypothetical protein
MVDTLAPNKIFTQRELDDSLTPVSEQVLRARPRPRLLDTTPVMGTEPSLLGKQTDTALEEAKETVKTVYTDEQEQTAKSSQETQDQKQTGDRVIEDAPQGLVMRPLEFAAKGYDNKEVSGPILVGEKGPEMIVPTGDGKISILPNNVVSGMMTKPMKKAEKGASDVTIGSATMMPATGPLPSFNQMDSQPLGMMPPTGPLPAISYGDLVSENDLDEKNQFRDAFNSKNIISGTAKGMLGKGNTAADRIYNVSQTPYGSSVATIIDKNFDDNIEPMIKENTDLYNKLPKNTYASDISSSIRDSFKHGYTAGYFSLISGRNTANDFSSNLGERLATRIDIPRIKRDRDTEMNREFIMDAYMDINNNRVGMDIADQAKNNLGFSPNDKLSEKDLVSVEKEFQKLYTDNFIKTLNEYDGDTNYSGYENLPTDKELKDLIYGEEGGAIKNRIETLFKDKVKDEPTPKQIIKFNPVQVNRRKQDFKEEEREIARGNDPFAEI